MTYIILTKAEKDRKKNFIRFLKENNAICQYQKYFYKLHYSFSNAVYTLNRNGYNYSFDNFVKLCPSYSSLLGRAFGWDDTDNVQLWKQLYRIALLS